MNHKEEIKQILEEIKDEGQLAYLHEFIKEFAETYCKQ